MLILRHQLEASLTRKGALKNASVPYSLDGNHQVGYQEDSETLEIQFVKGGSISFQCAVQQCSMNL